MGSIQKIALRNLLRHKSKTFLTAFTVAAGILCYIYFDSMIKGMNDDGIENIIELQSASVKVMEEEYYEKQETYPLDKSISAGKAEKIKSAAKGINFVKGACKRTPFLARLMDYENDIPVMAHAVEREADKTVFSIHEFVEDGEYFSEESRTEIIIGSGLAKDFGVNAGDYIVMRANMKSGMLNEVEYKIKGVVNTPNPEINRSSVFISYEAADYLLGIDGSAAEIYAAVARPMGMSLEKYDRRVFELRDMLKREFPEQKTISYKEAVKDFLAMMEQEAAFSAMFYFAILIIAAVGIVNSVLMSVYERTREVGVLRAMGFSGSELVRMFMYEGIMIGMLGSLGGILLGVLANIQLIYFGLDFTSMVEQVGEAGLPIDGMIYGEWNLDAFIFSVLFGVVISFVASLPPAMRAAKINVTKALRFE